MIFVEYLVLKMIKFAILKILKFHRKTLGGDDYAKCR